MPPADSAINVALILKRGSTGIQDLTKLAGYLREESADLHPTILRDRRNPLRRVWLARRPTLVFSPASLWYFRPLRGAVLQGHGSPKNEEFQMLERCGLPVPRWRLESDVTREWLAELGPYAVTKPVRGGRGKMVKIKRSSRIRPPKADGADARQQRIVQKFVYTGRWPVSYRVTTMFGEVLWSARIEADHSRNPLEGPEAFGGPGASIVSSGKGCTVALNYERDVIELGERAHAAFPDVPVLGVDIVRDAQSGELFVLETNPAGKVWSFSTKTGLSVQAQFGFRYEEQFDGLRKAARILAREARQRAC
jgi:hypothetical protein